MTRTALYDSGVIVPNGVIGTQLKAGAHSFTVPLWNDLADDEANIVTDDPNTNSTPYFSGSWRNWKEVSQRWCPEEDLNLHALASTST